jgi:hypothetical protein
LTNVTDAIDVFGLRKSFGQTHALDGLDLSVRDGEGHGFLAPTTGERARVNASETWTTISVARAAISEGQGYDGVGFMPSSDDPYTMIDLDDCRNLETGEVETWALGIVQRFGSLTLVSPSGTGLHIWIRGTLLHLLPHNKGGFKRRGIEAYSAKHFMTWTGEIYSGETIEERQGELSEIYQELHPEPEPPTEREPGPPIAPSVATLTNDELLNRARRAKKLGTKFLALYDRGDLGYIGRGSCWACAGKTSTSTAASCGFASSSLAHVMDCPLQPPSAARVEAYSSPRTPHKSSGITVSGNWRNSLNLRGCVRIADSCSRRERAPRST